MQLIMENQFLKKRKGKCQPISLLSVPRKRFVRRQKMGVKW